MDISGINSDFSELSEMLAEGIMSVADDDPQTDSGNKYEIISIVAYLIGVPKRIFENEHEAPKMEYYERLKTDKGARIIRNLCMTRTSVIRNFLKICHGIQRENKTIIGMPELVDEKVLLELSNDGVDIYKNLSEPDKFVFMLNQYIQARINNCACLFPDFIKWDYVKEMFIMPKGTTKDGEKKAAEIYYANMAFYPYQCYINWEPLDEGNILYCDAKFVSILYKWHGDEFRNMALVSDVSSRMKGNIYDFIGKSGKCIFVVDCENSDPYNLCAAIRMLDADKMSKIDKIILYDDVHTSSGWEILGDFIDIPIEYVLTQRLKEDKSLVDIKVVARISKEFYAGGVDSFVIVSSDSDYWGMIEEMPDANFLTMIEHDKVSPALKTALSNNRIFYCYIDDFYAGGGDEIKAYAIQKELYEMFDDMADINLEQMFDDVLLSTRISMSDEEKGKYLEKKIKKALYLDIDDEMNVKIRYRIKK